MNAIEVKIARKAIASPEYRSKRMDQMNREIVYWVACESVSNTARQRGFCREMQQMFMKRYQYYLNGHRKSNG